MFSLGIILYVNRLIEEKNLMFALLCIMYHARTKRWGGGAGDPNPPGKSRHHWPVSETPLKWRFAVGLRVAGIDY